MSEIADRNLITLSTLLVQCGFKLDEHFNYVGHIRKADKWRFGRVRIGPLMAFLDIQEPNGVWFQIDKCYYASMGVGSLNEHVVFNRFKLGKLNKNMLVLSTRPEAK